MGKVNWKKDRKPLTGNAGCEGCRKRCIYNGMNADPSREAEKKGFIYGCNSSLS